MVLGQTKQMGIVIERDDANNCSLLIADLDNIRVDMSDPDPGDIEILFNRVFKWIIGNEKLIEFFTNDEGKDLYNEVVNELIIQLNSEIKQSENDFNVIIELLGSNVDE